MMAFHPHFEMAQFNYMQCGFLLPPLCNNKMGKNQSRYLSLPSLSLLSLTDGLTDVIICFSAPEPEKPERSRLAFLGITQ